MKSILSFLALGIFMIFSMNSCGSEECTENSCPTGEECNNGDCVYITPLCEACGTYSGQANGTLGINLGLDTFFMNVPIKVKCVEGNIAYDYNAEFDVSSLLGSPAGTLVPNAHGKLNGNTITIVNQNYDYQGVAIISIDGTLLFNQTFDSLSGSLILSDDVHGTITFTAQRQ